MITSLVVSGTVVCRAAAASFERWYLRGLLALARRDGAEATIAALAPRLAEVETQQQELAHEDRLATICERLVLDPLTADMFAATAAFAADPRIPPHAEALGGPLARRGLSVATFSELAELSPDAGQALVTRLAINHPLLDYELLVVGDELGTHAARPYTIPARLLPYLHGDDVCEPGVVRLDPDPTWIFDPKQRATLEELRHAMLSPGAPLIILEGCRGTGRRAAAAIAAGRSSVVLDADRITPELLPSSLRGLRREAFLRDTFAIVAGPDLSSHDAPRHHVALALERFSGPLVIVTSRQVDVATTRPTIHLRWPIPDVEHRRKLWLSYATRGAEPAGDLDLLAIRYRVGPGAIARAVSSAVAISDDALDADALSLGLRHNIGEQMGGLAQRIEVTQKWDDVVLAEDISDQVQALIARVRHSHKVLEQWGYRNKMARGAGVAAMFSGPPGTGKTMVAGLIARELDLELYQVDLSQVVSKWVGETEKQLSRVFDAAEEGHALLLFDEADALFGQRSADVKGATDRYANLEVNFLLQRIEAFGGITVLTTNLDANIDRALKRRLAAHIVFAIPDEDERTALWQRLTRTDSAPIDSDIDFGDLARAFPMSGANIRNATFSAAFLAAADSSSSISHEHLVRAARAEYRSMGHVLAERPMGRNLVVKTEKAR